MRLVEHGEVVFEMAMMRFVRYVCVHIKASVCVHI